MEPLTEGGIEVPSNKTAGITFRNPELAENADRVQDKKEYYYSLMCLRNKLGRDINMLVGEWLWAWQLAETEHDVDKMEDSLEYLFRYESMPDVEITVERKEE